jgi:Glycosyl transferase family 11
MVTVFLRGGLGNQMFQYAAGLALAKKNNTELVLDTVFLNDRIPRRNFTYRTYDLDIFMIAPRFTMLSKCSRSVPVPGMWLGMDLAAMKISALFGISHIAEEKKEFAFDPELLEEKGDVILWGRWQNERYFKDHEGAVRAAFTFRDPLDGEAEVLARDIRSSNSVSVHVRRGDFVAFKNVAKMMGATDLSYYARAAAHIAGHMDTPKFFVFSDDVDWCRDNLTLPFPTVYVPASAEGSKAAFHLRLMSLCKHNIVANSTFSWWGAWLNQNPNKIVIAPKKWYADGRDERNEIMPEGWIKL